MELLGLYNRTTFDRHVGLRSNSFVTNIRPSPRQDFQESLLIIVGKIGTNGVGSFKQLISEP